MNSKKAEIIKQFEELGYIVTPIKDVKETFADYFSNMDVLGWINYIGYVRGKKDATYLTFLNKFKTLQINIIKKNTFYNQN